MPITVTPYIPQTITVHTGPANQWAENVTVPFIDYILRPQPDLHGILPQPGL